MSIMPLHKLHLHILKIPTVLIGINLQAFILVKYKGVQYVASLLKLIEGIQGCSLFSL